MCFLVFVFENTNKKYAKHQSKAQDSQIINFSWKLIFAKNPKKKKKKKKKLCFLFCFQCFYCSLERGRFYRSMFPDTSDRFLVFAKRIRTQTVRIPKLSTKLEQTKQSQRPFEMNETMNENWQNSRMK